MEAAATSPERMALEQQNQDQQLSQVVQQEQSRLREFIRRRVPDPGDVDDVLQDVFYKLVEANRLLVPIEHVTAWLFRVARNRITDLFRKHRPELYDDLTLGLGSGSSDDGETLPFADLLRSPAAGPDEVYSRQELFDALAAAIEELPPTQRDVFVAHTLEGRSFQDLAAASGVSVNTLLSRQRYAVRRLRERLQSFYEESKTK